MAWFYFLLFLSLKLLGINNSPAFTLAACYKVLVVWFGCIFWKIGDRLEKVIMVSSAFVVHYAFMPRVCTLWVKLIYAKSTSWGVCWLLPIVFFCFMSHIGLEAPFLKPLLVRLSINGFFFHQHEKKAMHKACEQGLFWAMILSCHVLVYATYLYLLECYFRCYDIQKDTLAFTAVDKFLPDQVYYHGCLKSFLQITKWNGPEVIYFGDHLFSDLRFPSKAGWRTAAIIHELESEIHIQNDENYRFQQAKFHIIQELLGKFLATVSRCQRGEAYQALWDELNKERQDARAAMRSMFNSSFGATFLTDTGQESAFSYHIHQYADVYTSKPDNFLLYPPEAWLHVPFDIKIMPHHVKVPSSLFKTW